ncbi:MAG: DUF4838 domain-containing protein [Lentisphaerae bacterium]|nr:DUF4838 domain-containing protein [Lentisphaerota bacterium]
MKKFLLLFAMAAVSVFAGNVDYTVETMKMESLYPSGGFLKGTPEKFSAMSKIPAKKGWNEIKAFNHHFKPEALYDGHLNYKGYVSTYAWSSHGKRLIFVLDVKKQQYVDQIAIWNNTSNQIEKVEITCGVEDKDGNIVWDKPASYVPEFDPAIKTKIIPLYYPVKKDVRKIKVVCSNHRPIALAVFEMRLLGNSPMQIVTPDKANAVEKFAAKELQHHLKFAGYDEIPIVPERAADKGRYSFYIGRSGIARITDFPRMRPGGFVLKTLDNGIAFAGNDEQHMTRMQYNAGSAYAVYEFFEREFNTRWVYPGDDGIVMNKGVKKEFSKYDVKWESPFKYFVYATGFFRNGDQWIHRTMRPVKADIQYVDNIGHAFTHWFREYGKTHPDWFARPSDKVPEKVAKLTAMCVSNDGFHQELIRRWLKKREANPGVEYFINCQENDTDGNCKCSKCMSWNGNQRKWSFWPDMMDTSNRYARFYKEVREKAAKYDPNVKTIGYAYKNYPFPADSVKLHPNNLIMVVTPAGRVQFPYPPSHKKEMSDWAESWLKSGGSILYRPNIFNGYVMPENTVKDFYEEIMTFMPVMQGVCIDGPNASWSTAGPQCYVTARIAVHPKAKLEDLLAEYYGCFGAAAPAIKEYWEYWEKYTYDNAQKFHDVPIKYNYGTYQAFFGFNYAWYAHRLFPQDVFDPAFKILDKAEKLAANSPEDLRRVQFLRKGLENAKLTAKTCEIFVEESYTKDQRLEALNKIRSFRKTLPPYCYNKGLAESVNNEQRVWKFSDFDPDRMVQLPVVWKLKLDPQNEGSNKKFYLEDISKWIDVKTDRSLENNGHTKTEYSWFALDFTVPEKFKGKRTELVLGAVDESCQVWVNGQYAGSYTYDPDINPMSYENPLFFDITKFLKPGSNRVIVRVINYIGHGGLWKISRLQFFNPDEVKQKVEGKFRRHQEKLETTYLKLEEFAFLIDEKSDGSATLKIIGGPGASHSRYTYYRVPFKNLANRRFKFSVEGKFELNHGKGKAYVELFQYNNRGQLIGKRRQLIIPANKEWARYSQIQDMLPEAASAKLFFMAPLTDAKDAAYFRDFTIEEIQ